MPEGRSHDSLLSSRPTHCLMAVAVSDTHPHTQPLTHTALSLAAHQEPKVRHFSTSEAETRVSHTASVRPCCTYTTVMLPTDPLVHTQRRRPTILQLWQTTLAYLWGKTRTRRSKLSVG